MSLSTFAGSFHCRANRVLPAGPPEARSNGQAKVEKDGLARIGVVVGKRQRRGRQARFREQTRVGRKAARI